MREIQESVLGKMRTEGAPKAALGTFCPYIAPTFPQLLQILSHKSLKNCQHFPRKVENNRKLPDKARSLLNRQLRKQSVTVYMA